MNIRHIVFLIPFVVLTACDMSPDTSIALEVVPGADNSLTVMGGLASVELLRTDLVNYTNGDIIVPTFPVSITHEDGTPSTAFANIRIVNANDGSIIDPSTVRVSARSTLSIALRADAGTAGDRVLVTLGSHAELIRDAVFSNMSDVIPAERIANNFALGRIVTVLPPEMMVVPHDTTALIVGFRPEQAILHSGDSSWVTLGTVTLDSYGGDSIFRGTRVFGANIGMVDELTFARDGVMVGASSTPVGACSCGSISMVAPLTVPNSGHIELEVWAHIASSPAFGHLTFGLEQPYDASSADGSEFIAITGGNTPSDFHIWQTSPMVVPQTLSSTSIAEGTLQDLYRLQISPEVPGTTLYLGSLTFRVVPSAPDSGRVGSLAVRIGSTVLLPDQVRFVRTASGAEIGAAETVGGLDEQFTVIFTAPGGYPVSGSGIVMTIEGTPLGFAAGDTLSISFGDTVFSGTYEGFSGNMNTAGALSASTGIGGVDYLIDPIIWSDGSVSGLFTGAWQVSDLSHISTLTHP